MAVNLAVNYSLEPYWVTSKKPVGGQLSAFASSRSKAQAAAADRQGQPVQDGGKAAELVFGNAAGIAVGQVPEVRDLFGQPAPFQPTTRRLKRWRNLVPDRMGRSR